MYKTITKYAMVAAMAFGMQQSHAQVGIGTTSPNPSAILDVTSTNRGLLLPRLNLTSTTVAAPLPAHVNGMTVYDLNTAGDVTPGMYYNDGAKWIRLASNDWSITGNSGTNPTNNFIGTKDNNALAFRTNNAEQMRLLTNGNLGVGETNPQQKLHVGGTASTIRIDAFNSTNSPTENNGTDLAPVAVNANGDLVLGGHTFLSDIELDDDDTTFINPTVYVRSTTGAFTAGALDSRTFTLTQETLVEINYNISYGVDDGTSATPAGSGAINDGMNRTVGCAVFIDEDNDGGAVLEGANAVPYSNDDSPWLGTTTFNSGYFTLTGSVYKVLPAGTHLVSVSGYVIGPTHTSAFNNGTVGAEFGGGYSRIMIIKHN